MRKTLILAIVGALLLTGLGVAVARLGSEDAADLDPSTGATAPSVTAPDTINPGNTAPEVPNVAAPPSKVTSPETTDTRPPVATSPTQPEPDPSLPQSKVVTPRPGMENVHKTPWDRSEILGDRTVRVHFVSGVEPCTVLDRVEVDHRSGTIVITLFEGNDPAAGEVACIMLAQFKAVDVQLSEPVGARSITDGAR